MKITLFLLLTTFGMHAKALTFDLETDPVFYAFDGSSAYLGFSSTNHRLELGVFQLKTDDEFHNNENFDLQLEGYGIKYDYLFGRYDGFFIGWEVNHAKATYTHTPSSTVFNRNVITTAPRLGYRFIFANFFTFSTTLAYDILVDDGEEVSVNQEEYKNVAGQLFPSLHIGFYF
jgi:hypothetical protein